MIETPNWCENKVVIYGPVEDLKSIKEHVKGEDSAFSLEKIIPIEVRDVDHQRMAWGTKWDVEATLAIESEHCIVYTFDSAWSPPVEVIIALSRKYPNSIVSISYDESGNDVGGLAVYKAGYIIEQNSGRSRYQISWHDQMSDVAHHHYCMTEHHQEAI